MISIRNIMSQTLTPCSRNRPGSARRQRHHHHDRPDVAATAWIEKAANEFLERGLAGVHRMPYERARLADCVHRHDYLTDYVADLSKVVDLERVRASGVMALGLLAAEITATTKRDPGQMYGDLTHDLGRSYYERIDAPATRTEMDILRGISSDQIAATEFAGEPIEAKLSVASGNGEPFGGIKVTARNGWFVARPSGTENVYKLYAESFQSSDHLQQIQQQAQSMVGALFKAQQSGGGRPAL